MRDKSSVVKIVRSLGLVAVKQNSVVSVVRDFILIVVKVKQRSERIRRFPFNCSEVRAVSVLSGEKQCSERSQRFHFNSGNEVKQRSGCSQ